MKIVHISIRYVLEKPEVLLVTPVVGTPYFEDYIVGQVSLFNSAGYIFFDGFDPLRHGWNFGGDCGVVGSHKEFAFSSTALEQSLQGFAVGLDPTSEFRRNSIIIIRVQSPPECAGLEIAGTKVKGETH